MKFTSAPPRWLLLGQISLLPAGPREMRHPLEDGVVTISRALRSTTFPADFMLVAAANPCPCGYRGDARRSCNCTLPQIEKYVNRISGPLLDRIDIHIEVPAVPFEELSSVETGSDSRSMREQVVRVARTIADIEGDAEISQTHLAEAINYRTLDANIWT